MCQVGHWRHADGRSRFRVFAPMHASVAVFVLTEALRIPLVPDVFGFWCGDTAALPDGSRYLIEVDGRRVPDVASRSQPDGVHGASAVAAPIRPSDTGWTGVAMADAILYELHLGTFTPAGTLVAAMERLDHLAAIGINVVELMPIAAFPGQRNWGYDGTYHFALHSAYGSYADLHRFIEAAHRLGIAVVLDVVHNHFGPEGNYAALTAPYTVNAPTPWGAAINLDREYNHGVRAFFLENVRHWIEDAGFDGLRMDAVSMMFDNMPVHLLRQATDLAHAIGAAQGRHVLMIAEHLRNDWHVTSPDGFAFDAQWNDDLNHALYAHLTGERRAHCVNFGSFADVVRALDRGFVLDGTRFDRYRCFMTGTDGAATHGSEHVVHTQNHDQVGNRLRGDRMIATHGRAKALLAVTAMMASPFVPMLFMGEEYGETAPFYFFEDFGDPDLVDAIRRGRLRDLETDEANGPPDPHAVATFEASRLDWSRRDTPDGQSMLERYRSLIALKRSGALGPRDRANVHVVGNADTRVIRIDTPQTVTVLNFSSVPAPAGISATEVLFSTVPLDTHERLPPFAAAIFSKRAV